MSTTQPAATSSLSQTKDVPGLLECTMTHMVSSTTASFKWTGPKIPKDEWNKVLSFFRWTYKEHNSESQVRLFVNRSTKAWAAWAFPQKARTGMNACELDTEETKIQRSMFKDSEGWDYFGTVHHHCSASAFQSSTDEQNEKNQDGIHITVGNMDKEQYDIHHRFYYTGYKMLMVKLTDVWDVTPELSNIPERLQKILLSNAESVASMQMGTPPPEDFPFPEVWKSNVIEVKVQPPVSQTQAVESCRFPMWSHSYSGPQRKLYRERCETVHDTDKAKAIRHMKSLIDSIKDNKPTMDDLFMSLEDAVAFMDSDTMEMMDIMMSCDLSIESLREAILEEEDREIQESLKPADSPKKKNKLTGMDPHIENYINDGGYHGYGY